MEEFLKSSGCSSNLKIVYTDGFHYYWKVLWKTQKTWGQKGAKMRRRRSTGVEGGGGTGVDVMKVYYIHI